MAPPLPTPTLTIHDPAPPADAPPIDVAVTHPLQALAMQSLNQGYNITDWLEAGPFTGFAPYDEAFVSSVAAAGFHALRLPIDLDRYILQRDAYFRGEVPFEVDPELFTILDAFNAWTLAHGLSLTIDYHQYDGSFDPAEPLYVDAVMQLWGAVAAHFAADTRPDLFFELLNEPEQAGGKSVEPATWRSFAAPASCSASSPPVVPSASPCRPTSPGPSNDSAPTARSSGSTSPT
mgnify:CR=1 FL=1